VEKSIKFYFVKGYNDLMTKKQLPLIVIIAVILGGLVFDFYYWWNFIKEGGTETSGGVGEETELNEKITQEEAMNLALTKYPGEVKNIDKKTAVSERDISSPAFWLVEISLKEPIFFEKVNKEIGIIQVKVTMDKNVDIYELIE